MLDVPLRQHALLSDCGWAALATGSGSGLAVPAPVRQRAVFARLMDTAAGHFLIAPAVQGFSAAWRYHPSSLVLETTWTRSDAELATSAAGAAAGQ